VTFCGVTRTISRSTSPPRPAGPARGTSARAAEQRLVPVLDQLGRAADVYGLVRVLGVEDCEADPWVPGEIPSLLAPRRGREEHKSPSLTIQTTVVCGPPSGFSVATVATFLPSNSLRVFPGGEAETPIRATYAVQPVSTLRPPERVRFPNQVAERFSHHQVS
jgi:hypothetical protein